MISRRGKRAATGRRFHGTDESGWGGRGAGIRGARNRAGGGGEEAGTQRRRPSHGEMEGVSNCAQGHLQGIQAARTAVGAACRPPLMQPPPHLPDASEKDPESPDERPGIG